MKRLASLAGPRDPTRFENKGCLSGTLRSKQRELISNANQESGASGLRRRDRESLVAPWSSKGLFPSFLLILVISLGFSVPEKQAMPDQDGGPENPAQHEASWGNEELFTAHLN